MYNSLLRQSWPWVTFSSHQITPKHFKLRNLLLNFSFNFLIAIERIVIQRKNDELDIVNPSMSLWLYIKWLKSTSVNSPIHLNQLNVHLGYIINIHMVFSFKFLLWFLSEICTSNKWCVIFPITCDFRWFIMYSALKIVLQISKCMRK